MGVARGIGNVRAAREHRHGGAARCQGAGVGRAVDAQGQAADHRHAGGAEVAPERARHLEPVGRCATGADHRRGRLGRRHHQRVQARRVPVVGKGVEADIDVLILLEVFHPRPMD